MRCQCGEGVGYTEGKTATPLTDAGSVSVNVSTLPADQPVAADVNRDHVIQTLESRPEAS